MFTCHRIDRREADNTLAATGVEWTEHREWISNVLMAFASVCALLSIFTLVGVMLMSAGAGGSGPWWIPALMTLALWSPLWWWPRLQFEGKPRQLSFERDGSMPAPLGFALWPRRFRSVSGHHGEIVSIEARQIANQRDAQLTAYTHGVAIIKRNGDIVYVAAHLHPDNAMKVAVQLTLALNDMRESLANSANNPGGGATTKTQSRAKPRASVLIE